MFDFHPLVAIAGFLTIPAVFWTLIVLETIGLVMAAEAESLVGAFFTALFIGGLGILEAGGFAPAIAFVKANSFIIGGGFIAYFILGTVWSRFKWGSFVTKQADSINEKINQYGAVNAAERLSYSSKFTKEEILGSTFACLAPQVMDYKKKVTAWIILWIPSFLYFLFNNPFRRIAEWIFNLVKDQFQAASDSIFKRSFKVQIPLPKEEVTDLTEEV